MGPAASSSWKPGKTTTASSRVILGVMAGFVGTMAFRPDHAGRIQGASSPGRPLMPKLTIVFALYPGVTHLDFTGPHQVLVRTPESEVIAASLGAQDIEAEGLVFARLADLAKIEGCDV